MKPLAIDLYAGLGGWAEGLLAEGFDVIGFDIEQHVYGEHRYPALLVIQDVRTLHGSQFKDAALIVASPPCQGYSYRAMPWKKAKALPPPDNTLFEACFRIQREACEAAGRHIPLIVENVRGAQKWVGRARWNFGSFYLWGDVPALMPIIIWRPKFKGGDRNKARAAGAHIWNQPEDRVEGFKSSGMNWSDPTKRGQDFTRVAGRQAMEGHKGAGATWDAASGRSKLGVSHWTNPTENGTKHSGSDAIWFDAGPAALSSKSSARKAASAMIAKIPLPLSRFIGATFRPR